ncbi:GGDEF domain-containing protein [Planosporangium sp. 12N6]|uniref:GGDEF domain-containing protein n=1 Tax=Planosporangium spinosum TaxID=3402278 RepID=UPI003CEA5C2A
MNGSGDGLDRAERRRTLAAATADAIVPCAFGLSVLFAFGAVIWLGYAALPWASVDASVNAVASLLFLGLAVWCRRNPMPERWAHPVAAGSYVVVLGIAALPLLQQRRALDTVNIILAVIGAGVFIRSLPWLLVLVLGSAAGWVAVAVQAPASAGFADFGYGMLMACVTSVVVNVVLRRTTLRLEAARAELRRLADLDPVTELYNRRGFLAVAERLRDRADRTGRPLVVLCVDVDRMKLINDRFGHAAGDAAIRETAALLRQALRHGDPIGRMGGDEFSAVLPDLDDPAPVVARLRELLRRAGRTRTGGHDLTLSIGFVGYDPRRPCSLDELLHRADLAMYAEKSVHRDHGSRPLLP